MSAAKQAAELLKQVRVAIQMLEPQREQLRQIIGREQNDGDGSFNEASWEAARDAVRSLVLLAHNLDVAVEAAEVTEVGRRRRKKP